MDAEAVILVWLLGLAFVPLIIHLRRRLSAAAGLAVLAVWLIATVGAGALALNIRPSSVPESSVTDRPIRQNAAGFASSQTCRTCHPKEFHSWHGSYHRTMTQLATPKSVVGDFNDQTIEYFGKTFRLTCEGDEYWAEMDDPSHVHRYPAAPRIKRRILLVTGSHHAQIYWYATGQTRKLAPLQISWIIEIQRWVPKASMVLVPPVRRFHDETGRWNRQCIMCHSTGEQPQLFTDRKMDTRVTDFGIACEACHGPGEEHIRLHSDLRNRYARRLDAEPDESITDPMRLTSARSSQICGQCHKIWRHASEQDSADWLRHGKNYKPGDNLDDTLITTRYGDAASDTERDNLKGLFWADGMVRVTAREYNGLIESPCYQRADNHRKMACSSCHGMHSDSNSPTALKEWADDQLKPGMRSNQACLQCHEDFNDQIEAHTHHRADSTGSLCYNCHMPHTAYGLHKAVRSHQIDSPSTANSLQTGRPNACNLCHLDKTLSWTAEKLYDWYAISPPELSADERNIAASVRWLLSGDAGQRALIAWSMGWQPAQEASSTNWLPPYLTQLLNDPYDAVRYIALRSLRRIPGYEAFTYDYLGSEEHILKGMDRAWTQWETGTAPGYAKELLLQADGNIDRKTFDRLLRDRDDSPVYLQE